MFKTMSIRSINVRFTKGTERDRGLSTTSGRTREVRERGGRGPRSPLVLGFRNVYIVPLDETKLRGVGDIYINNIANFNTYNIL